MGDYKLIVNKQSGGYDPLMWSPLDYPCQDGPKGETCDPYCLYNIVEDPNEHNALSQKELENLQEILQCYNEYAKKPRDMQDQGYRDGSHLPILMTLATT